MTKRLLRFESLSTRCLLAADVFSDAADDSALVAPGQHEHGTPVAHPDYPVPVYDLGHDVVPIFGWDHADGTIHVHGEMTLNYANAKYILVFPGATLHLVGTADAPLDISVNTIFGMRGSVIDAKGIEAGRISFQNQPLETWDKYQFGRGIISLGDVDIQGLEGRTKWDRAVGGLTAGQTELVLNQVPVDWQVGDLLSVAGTIQYKINVSRKNTSELVTISAIDGNTITLEKPLANAHPMSSAGDTPVVANMSRGFDIVSESPLAKGHLMFIHESRPIVRNVEFIDVGRDFVGRIDEKKIARYALHNHHLDAGPLLSTGERYIVDGNSFRGFGEWGITIHDSHYGVVKDNVLHGLGNVTVQDGGNGAGIVLERIEVGNQITGNYVASVFGGGPNLSSSDQDTQIFAENGAGIWARLAGNDIIGNVLADTEGLWFNGYYFADIGDSKGEFPLWPTAAGQPKDQWETGDDQKTMTPGRIDDNEIIGSQWGLWFTFHLGARVSESIYPVHDMRGNVVWHPQVAGVEAYHVGGIHLHDFRVTGDRSIALAQGDAPAREVVGVQLGNHSYSNDRFALYDSVIENMNLGISLPTNVSSSTSGPIMIERTEFLGNVLANARLGKRDNADIRFVDVIFGTEAKYDVQLTFPRPKDINPKTFAPASLTIESAGKVRKVFWTQQSPNYVIPEGTKPLEYTGKTNQQLVDEGLAPIAGELATTSNVDPRFAGAFVEESQ